MLLHEGFLSSVKKYPNNIAIESPTCKISYKELFQFVNTIANNLSPLLDNTHYVSIMLPKSWEQIAVVLAILLCGKAYIPIDYQFPIVRIKKILDKSKTNIIITNHAIKNSFSSEIANNVLYINELLTPKINHGAAFNQQVSPTDIAYIIFTSGTTGEPKGVMISHKAVLNTLHAVNDLIGFKKDDSIFGISNLNFDLSVYDIFGTFSVGAKLVLPSDYHDVTGWLEYVTTSQITVWNSVPQLFNTLLDYIELFNKKLTIKNVLLSGDWIPPSLISRAKILSIDNINCFSLGGATEGSIWSIQHKIEYQDLLSLRIPYGTPLSGQTVMILDSELNLSPINTPGEIYIGGEGLAQGYVDDYIQTEKSFSFHPSTQQKLYRTGDIGKYRPDGLIEFMGRSDDQIKIRSNRVELREIDTICNTHPKIKQSFAVYYKKPFLEGIYLFIIAYSKFKKLEIEEFLKLYLPDYMIPRDYFFVDAIPLTINGKIDATSLNALIDAKISQKVE